MPVLFDWAGVGSLGALGVHIVVYAFKEGRKEQRLQAVEEKVKAIGGIETTLASVTATMAALGGKIDDLKSDIREDIASLRGQLTGR